MLKKYTITLLITSSICLILIAASVSIYSNKNTINDKHIQNIIKLQNEKPISINKNGSKAVIEFKQCRYTIENGYTTTFEIKEYNEWIDLGNESKI